MKHLIYILPAFCVILFSCGHQCACDPSVIRFSFIGYADSAIDSIRIIRFPADGQFGSPVDSILLTSANSYVTAHSDTLDLDLPYSNNFEVKGGSDWEVINLRDNLLIRFSQIQSAQKTMHCGGIISDGVAHMCFSPITSFVANGIEVDPVNTTINGDGGNIRSEARYYISK